MIEESKDTAAGDSLVVDPEPASSPAPEPESESLTASALVLEDDDPPYSPLNWALIAGGVMLTVVGFVLLRSVDARATNWQAIWSPILILAGYAVVFLGILIVREEPSVDEDGDAAAEGSSATY